MRLPGVKLHRIVAAGLQAGKTVAHRLPLGAKFNRLAAPVCLFVGDCRVPPGAVILVGIAHPVLPVGRVGHSGAVGNYFILLCGIFKAGVGNERGLTALLKAGLVTGIFN